MVAKSKANGHDILHKDGAWVYSDTEKPIDTPRPCRHCGRAPVYVQVKIPADLSSTGVAKWKRAQIDACIAPIVRALQTAGIDMRGSCCGHGEGEGDIHLQDGRALFILSPEEGQRYYAERRND